jgi:hypothetical protein
MYPEFAAQAQAEGNKEAATLFRMIAKIEAEHRNRYAKLLEMVENGSVFKRDRPIRWKCSVCGYIHEGTNREMPLLNTPGTSSPKPGALIRMRAASRDVWARPATATTSGAR